MSAGGFWDAQTLRLRELLGRDDMEIITLAGCLLDGGKPDASRVDARDLVAARELVERYRDKRH